MGLGVGRTACVQSNHWVKTMPSAVQVRRVVAPAGASPVRLHQMRACNINTIMRPIRMNRTFGVALGAELRREAAVGGHGELGDHHGAAGCSICIHHEHGTSGVAAGAGEA